MRESIERHQHFAVFGVGVADTFGECFGVEIQAAEVAGVGIVLQAQIYPVRAVVYRCLECGQATSGADEFEQWFGHGCTCYSGGWYFIR